MDSEDWRDWANHPEAVTAIWPRALASGMPPASFLALMGTCQHTRNAVLLDAPHTKLTVQLGPEQPAAGPLLLLKQSGRTQPTALALLNSSTTVRSETGWLVTDGNSIDQLPVDPHAASSYAQHILISHSTLLGCITRLDLQGVVVDTPLLQAMQGLPALTYLHLTNIHLPAQAYVYQAASLPQGVRTLHIELQAVADEAHMAALTSLLTEFLMLDTITDLTITSYISERNGDMNITGACLDALEAVTQRGHQARALYKLSLPRAYLNNDEVACLQRDAPLLEELQAFTIGFVSAEEEFWTSQLSWRTLRVHDLYLSRCRYLPLGGTEPLDIHISGILRLCPWGLTDGLLEDIMHLTSPHTRPVRLVGSGRDGCTFTWDYRRYHTDLVACLSVLQLSKAPVRRLLLGLGDIDVKELLMVLQPLPALTHLRVVALSWDVSGNAHDLLLARLPLHVAHVRLRWYGDSQAHHTLFSRMAVAASTVPERQAHPLRLCVVGEEGPGSEVWEAVEECRARGDMGVVIEEEWE